MEGPMRHRLASLVLVALVGCADGAAPGDPKADTGLDSGLDTGAPPEDCVVYQDADGDGYGDDATASTANPCEVPDGYTTVGGDCDDLAAEIHPRADEPCDGVDNDCDDKIDERLASGPYLDEDGDGYGAGEAVEACDSVGTYVRDNSDCDDGDPGISPAAEEIVGNGIDENCNGADGLLPLGADTSAFAVCASIAYDQEGDGVADSLAFGAFDAHDNLLLWVMDREADDTIDWFYTYAYDERDLLATQDVDLDGDLVTDYRYIRTYDADQRLLSYETDFSADGTVDDVTSYTYDAAGDLELIYAEDWGAPYEIEYTYDGDHHNLSWTFDKSVDGDIEEEWTGTWSEDGTLSSASLEADWDWSYDWECDYEWTDAGLLAKSACRGEAYSGLTIDQWEYDEAGWMTVHERHDEDDVRWTYTYDTSGALILEETDVDIDGVVDSRYTVLRDADGRPLEETGRSADGSVSYQVLYSYGCY